MKYYFPPARVLCEALDIPQVELSGDGEVTIPASVLRSILQLAMSDLHLDDKHYRSRNPDVARALARKADLLRHFVTTGYFENRLMPIHFDPNFYLDRYGDVRDAIERGEVADARQHYDDVGIHEGRLPSDIARADVQEWGRILDLQHAYYAQT